MVTATDCNVQHLSLKEHLQMAYQIKKPLGTSMDEWIPSTANPAEKKTFKEEILDEGGSSSEEEDITAPPKTKVINIVDTEEVKTEKSFLFSIVEFWVSDHWLLNYIIGNANRIPCVKTNQSLSYVQQVINYGIPGFIIAMLRGAGQVVFMNNPWSGLSILIGLFIQSKWIAFIGIKTHMEYFNSFLFSFLLLLSPSLSLTCIVSMYKKRQA